MNVTTNNRFALLLAEKCAKESRNISISEVSEQTGISRRALHDWETNSVTRFDAPIIDALCKYFGVGPGELLEYIPDDKKKK